MMEDFDVNIDNIIKRVNFFKKDPAFSLELLKRKNKVPPSTLSEDELLEILVSLISYSQQAQSALVKKILDRKVFNEILSNYSVEKVTKMNPCDIVEQHWHKITGIRQQTKLFQIVMFARAIQRDKTILSLLTKPPIPLSIKSENEITDFWNGFRVLQFKLRTAKVPFIRETTSLLHFLLELGYDCIKPDSAVMKASKQIGIIENEKGEKNFISTVRCIQSYCVKNRIRPSVVDLHLLIFGGQTDAASLVDNEFYNKSK